ncbi:MAG: VWA domain-containing protein [candidate division Zixibacteria bacterium]|nr:VWA domain-containing protein [candidate division Zixibacteria bacterium]
MRFSEDMYFYALLLIPMLLIFLKLSGAVWKKRVREFGDEGLFGKLTSSVSNSARKVKMFFVILACFFFVVALAGPQIGTHTVMVKREGIDIIIAVDTSKSMLAEDNNRPPNRLTRAKYEISTLIDEKLEGDRVGIVAFAGDAFVQCPLTIDYSAAKLFLDILSANLIPVEGTDLEKAINTATKAYKEEGKQQKVLIIITDGENHQGDPLAAAERAAEKGIIIYTIGIGNPDGEPIPMRDQYGNLIGYKKDREGNIVVSKLDERTLQEISRITEGKYFHATPGGNELDLVYRDIAGMEKEEFEGRLMTVYEDRFQWPLLAGIILLTVEFLIPERRRRNGS